MRFTALIMLMISMSAQGKIDYTPDSHPSIIVQIVKQKECGGIIALGLTSNTSYLAGSFGGIVSDENYTEAMRLIKSASLRITFVLDCAGNYIGVDVQ